MKNIIIIILFTGLLMSCAHTKHSESHVVNTRDTLVVHDTMRTVQRDTMILQERVHDTVIGVASKRLEDQHSGTDLQPGQNSKGHKEPKHFSKYQDGIFIYLDVDTNGNFKYGAQTDSITLAIRNLTERNRQLTRERDSSNNMQVLTGHKSDSSDMEKDVKVMSWLASLWPWLLGVVLVVIVWFIIKRFL